MIKKGQCADVIFPFQGINNESLLSIWSDYVITNKKTKCFACKKITKKDTPLAHCRQCRYYFHRKCEKIKSNIDTPLPPDWICSGCIMKALPFANIDDETMNLTSQGFSDENIDFVMDKYPSFSIKSLLDEMSGQKIDTDEHNTF